MFLTIVAIGILSIFFMLCLHDSYKMKLQIDRIKKINDALEESIKHIQYDIKHLRKINRIVHGID